ncbi:MAG: hypothetical protein PHW46_04165, partial [Candidatus Omnitrophica bacterium]|nr:hypothetical protein [Candidatus Omnitrophota bacterium]
MRNNPNRRMVIKMISAMVAGIFLWTQIVWAADLPSTIPLASGSASGSMTAGDLTQSQTNAELLVSTLNAIEDDTPPVPKSPHGLEYDGTPVISGTWTYYRLNGKTQEAVNSNGQAYVYTYYKDTSNLATSTYYTAGGVWYS